MWKITYSDGIIQKVAAWDPDLLAQINTALKTQDWHKFPNQTGWLRFVTPYFPQRNYRVFYKVSPGNMDVNILDIAVERAYFSGCR